MTNIIDRLSIRFPDVPKDVLKAIVSGGWVSLRARMTMTNKSPKREVLLRGLGKFYIATEATHKRGRKALNKYKRKYVKKVVKKKREKINMQDIKYLLRRQK